MFAQTRQSTSDPSDDAEPDRQPGHKLDPGSAAPSPALSIQQNLLTVVDHGPSSVCFTAPIGAVAWVRQATRDDLGEIVDLVLAAMPLDPQWNYRYPRRLEYPEDQLRHTRLAYEATLDAEDEDWRVMIVEVPVCGMDEGQWDATKGCGRFLGAGKGKATKIVAFAVWDLSYVNQGRRARTGHRQPSSRNTLNVCRNRGLSDMSL